MFAPPHEETTPPPALLRKGLLAKDAHTALPKDIGAGKTTEVIKSIPSPSPSLSCFYHCNSWE